MLAFVFAELVLGQNVSARQGQTNPSEEPNPPTESVLKKQHSADEEPEPNQENPENSNENAIGDQGAALVKRVSKLANKTNFALFFSFLATLFAGLSWRTGKDAVDVTREIGEKQSCAYIKMNNVRVGHNFSHAICEIIIENVGNSPCVEGSITAKIKSENTLVVPFMETNEIRDFYSPDETRNFGIIQTGHTHKASFTWHSGHPDNPDTWFDLFLSDIGADSRVIFDVRWKDVFGKWHTSSFEAHKHHGKGINWEDMRIWSESVKINPQQKYERDK
jgi:hypothetical protein